MTKEQEQKTAEASEPQTEHDYMGLPTKPQFGKIRDKTVASVTMVIVSGSLAGWEFPFTVKDWGDNLKYDVPRLKAVGWKGKSFSTFVSDINAFAATGKLVMFRARLAVNHKTDSTWWTASSIGRYEPTVAPATQDDVKTADSFLDEYNQGQGVAPAPRQYAAPATYSSVAAPADPEDVPVMHDDDLPF